MHIKEDCYWYWRDNDMGARIPYCTAKKGNQPLESCDECVKYHSKYKPSNADRIRSMTDEELAVWMNSIIKERNIEVTCDGWLSWLKSPADKETADAD